MWSSSDQLQLEEFQPSLLLAILQIFPHEYYEGQTTARECGVSWEWRFLKYEISISTNWIFALFQVLAKVLPSLEIIY